MSFVQNHNPSSSATPPLFSILPDTIPRKTPKKMETQNYNYDNNNYSSQSGICGGITMMLNWLPNLVETQFNMITSLSPTSKPAIPSREGTGTGTGTTRELVKRVCKGLMGAVYVGLVLSFVMVVAVLVGVVLVNYWVEEPVSATRVLYFDYTVFNPHAVVVFGDGVGVGVGVGHKFCVSVSLLVPDSDYNRDVGVFQIMAEVISTNGKIVARSSQPSMLRFQSHPIRLMRTFAMGLPLVLGLARETQKITVQVLNYKETTHLRTEAIRITLMPRAGTSYLPQLYEAEILMQSKLPRLKELVYNWKWTFYVWTSSYIFTLLLLLLVYFFKPLLVYPISRGSVVSDRSLRIVEREETPDTKLLEEREFTVSPRKWQQYRKERKAEILGTGKKDDTEAMSSSSYTITKDDILHSIEEDVGDSESVCKG